MQRLLVYNICYGMGFSGSALSYLAFWKYVCNSSTTNKIAQFISRQKVNTAVLIETDFGARSSSQTKIISTLAQLPHTIERIKYKPRSVISRLPFFSQQGNSLLSKYPLTDVRTFVFDAGIKRVLFGATILASTPYVVLVVHLSLGKRVRKTQLAQLAKLMTTITQPCIVCGDFNASMAEILVLLKHTSFRKVQLQDEFHGCATFPAKQPKKELDYIFVSPQIRVKSAQIKTVPYSDHLPLVIDFDIVRK
jgi:endonuclease/exonuclease/phosphatase family metal-dependent hydrolase